MSATERLRRVFPSVSSRRAVFDRMLSDAGVDCEIELPDGEHLRYGGSPPAFRVRIRSPRVFRRPLTEYWLGRGYVEGDIDLEGDMLALFDARDLLADGGTLRAKAALLVDLFLSAPTLVNRRAIRHHYSFGDDFFLGFVDRDYRFYSHGLFHSEDETLEAASAHKLESMWEALSLRPGMRLLDIGGGWGGVVDYCGSRGVHVTSLTIAPQSYDYLGRLIRDEDLPAEVLLEDFLTHRPRRPYDAAVILGVIEHIPNYRAFCARAYECLAPRGKLYMDASAAKQKFSASAFTRRYAWAGHHSFMCLQDIVQEMLLHGFEVLRVRHEAHDYALTMRHWAERFDAREQEIVERWGDEVYRWFRVYLWGGTHAFVNDGLQAYSLVVRKGSDPGSRPGSFSRMYEFLRSLR